LTGRTVASAAAIISLWRRRRFYADHLDWCKYG